MSNPNIAHDSPATWKPGQSGNPNGRPKAEWTWSGLIRQKMEELLPGADQKAVKDAVATALAEKAISGDIPAIKEIGDRIDGKPMQSTDITTKGEKIETNAIVFTDFKNATTSK